MGIFKAIGSVVGGAIGFVTGGPAGAATGFKLGGTVGGVADKKKPSGSSSSGASTQYIEKPKVPTLDDIRSKSPSALSILNKREEATKVAQSADVPAIKGAIMDDPWKVSRDLWEDLGGEPDRYGPIDTTRI
jgi:hypothetical protein